MGSGINDARPKLLALLVADQGIGLIVVEHRDRLTCFGFRYLDTLLSKQGLAIEVVNQTENGTEDVLADLRAIMYSCCAEVYGQRRAKRKTEAIVRELEGKEAKGTRRGPAMQLVEQYVIKRADPRFAAIDCAALASKNLYHAANYVLRQSFIHDGIHDGIYLNYAQMHRRMKDHGASTALPAKVAQWVLRILDKNWASCFAALVAWQADPSQF